MSVYSIIQKSQLGHTNRIDAEYYQPVFLELEKNLLKLKSKTLEEAAQITGGKRLPVGEIFSTEGIPYVRIVDFYNIFIDISNVQLISDRLHKLLERYQIRNKDILLTIVGNTVGLIGYNQLTLDKINFTENCARIRSKSLLPEYLLIALLSRIGQLQVLREKVGTAQPKLSLDRLRRFLVPITTNDFQLTIKSYVDKSLKFINESENFYSQAANLLLEELGLRESKAWEIEELSYIVNLSAVKSANRADAEYFQPKYEKLISKLKSQNAKLLGDFIEDYSTGYPFKSGNYQEEGIPLIRINNIRKGYIDLGDTAYLSEKDYLLSPKDTAKSGDIVLSMSGTIGMSAIISDGITKCSINQRILRTTSKNISRDYLVLVLNSIVGSFQLERIGTGGVQTNISYKDIKNILIPELPKLTQQKIADLVQKSHKARKKSKELLEEAKRKVETSIETQSKGDDR